MLKFPPTVPRHMAVTCDAQGEILSEILLHSAFCVVSTERGELFCSLDDRHPDTRDIIPQKS